MSLGFAVRTSQACRVITGVVVVAACMPGHPAGRGVQHRRGRGDLAQRVDRLLAQSAADSGFSGTALIALEGRVVLHHAYGWADAKRTRRVTTSTPYWIASISKQFAAAAVLKLAEQGRLSIDDSLARLLDDVPVDKRRITLHQLLTHTAGLRQRYAADGITDRDSAVRVLLADTLQREPGAGYQYSNDAYSLIAAIVEITAGQPYEQYVRDALLEPAGLRETGFWGPAEHPDVAPVLGGHGGTMAVPPNWGFRGAVGMYSTSGDLYRWHLALARHRVLTEANVERLLTAHTRRGETGVGYGWFRSRTARGTPCVWTRGYEDFRHGAVLATYPEDGAVIVVMSNSGDRDGDPVSHILARRLEALLVSGP